MAKTRPGLVVYRSELIMSGDEKGHIGFYILVYLLFAGFTDPRVARAQEDTP